MQAVEPVSSHIPRAAIQLHGSQANALTRDTLPSPCATSALDRRGPDALDKSAFDPIAARRINASAKSVLTLRGKRHCYSITSSARSRIDVGSSIPIALAVLRLMAVSNFVAWSTGKSPAFAPLRILAT